MKTIDPEKAREYFESKITYTLGPKELEWMMEQKKNILGSSYPTGAIKY